MIERRLSEDIGSDVDRLTEELNLIEREYTRTLQLERDAAAEAEKGGGNSSETCDAA